MDQISRGIVMSDSKWIDWEGTFIVENDIVHLKADESPEVENLSCELKDVLIDGVSLKIRVGAIISGLTCKRN